MTWERHVAKEFPPVMVQVLEKYQKLTVQVVTEVEGDFIIKKWKRQEMCLWQEHFFLDTSRQNWMGRSQPSQMPQQDSFRNNFQTGLACGQYSVLSSMYAVRNWKLDLTNRSTLQGLGDGWQRWARWQEKL